MGSKFILSAAAFAAAVALSAPSTAQAAAYPGNKCVAAKLKTASANCKSVLGAWAKFVGSGGGVANEPARDASLAKAASKMTAGWDKADAAALKKGTDCADTTLSDAAMQALITGAVAGIVTDVTTGLNLAFSDDAKCGSGLLKASGDLCAAIIKNEGGYIAKLEAGTGKRDAANLKADTKFTASVAKAIGMACPTAASEGSLETAVDGVTGSVITNSIISPNVSNTEFDIISPPEFPGIPYEGSTLRPLCSRNGSPYHFFVKRGSVNKLVMYYQGGGACWNGATCNTIGTFDQEVIPNGTCDGGTNDGELCDTLADCPDQISNCAGGSNDLAVCTTSSECPGGSCGIVSCDPGSDNPNNTSTGFGDLTNPDNPFKDWNIVFVSYCSGDIHFGDATSTFGAGPTTVNFRGWHNARVAEKFAREHFVAPEEVFVTGSSAGAYGAFFNAPLHHPVWPDSKFTVLADAGNGIITPDFIDTKFPVWNFVAHLPTEIPGVLESITDATGIPAFTDAVATFFPDTAWGHYTSSYDGGTGGQTGFYNVMLNDGNVAAWPSWWNASCEWNDIMRAQAIATAAAQPANYRYYIGTGSRHTMYGSDKVYTDTTGTVPTIKDWVNSMLARDIGWTNVECDSETSCGTLLTGDPRPSPLTAPFNQVGPDVVIQCP